MTTHFIYTLSDPRTNRVRYVGCTRNATRRQKEHLSSLPENPSPKHLWVDELRQIGTEPIFTIVDSCEDEVLATSLEKLHYSKNNDGELLCSDPSIYEYKNTSGIGCDAKIQIRLPIECLEKLKGLSKKSGLSVSAYIRMFIMAQPE